MRAVRRHPGPSRWAYRLRRAWAKPWLRGFVKGYLPLLALAVLGWWVVSNDRLRLALASVGAAVAERLAARPEFAVRGVAIEGADPALVRRIEAATGALDGRSSLVLDLAALRDRVAALPGVAEASAVFDPGGIVRITVVRRVPAALWRGPEGLALIDAEGVRLGMAGSRIAYPELPLLIGEGAPGAVSEALALLETAPALAPRLRAAVRVGERRWDLVLDRGLRVMLPEANPLGALRGVMALDEAQGLLDRDLAAVDVRVRARPTLRAAPRGDDGVGHRWVPPEGEDT